MNNNNRIQEPTFLSNDNIFYRLALLEEKRRMVQAHYRDTDKVEDEYKQDEMDIKYGYTSRRSR